MVDMKEGHNGKNGAEVKKIDPWLLKTIDSITGMPYKPYDLTRIKTITKWYNQYDPALQLWQHGASVGDWLKTETGAFDLLGEMPNLHTLVFPHNFFHKDYAFLANCKKLKKLDLGETDFQDCSLLAQLPALRYLRLPCKGQLINTEVLGQLKAKMEFTNYFAQENKIPAPGQRPNPMPSPTPYQGELPLNALLENLKARTKVPAYRLRVLPGVNPGLADSKIGGIPYWDMHQPYPVDEQGLPMQLLAQINFSQESMGPPFPQAGLLQFFIGLDDMFGCNFGSAPEQTNYRVVYHLQVDESVSPEQVSALGAPGLVDNYRVSPLEKVLAIHAQREDCFANDRSLVFEEAFRAAVKEVMGVDMGQQLSYEFLDDEAYDWLYDSLSETDDGCMNGGHWMLGYPNFTQEDPRSQDSPFNTLLLQIDSMEEEGRNPILWGDCGVANFFIPQADLENLDFSRVLYNWDCC